MNEAIKPVVFLSHSTKDKKLMNLLKKFLNKKCKNEIDFFLSSDGQSIQFGHNWVHTLQEGLDTSKLMFVFMSPNSIESGWIYFESGYAKSKGIKVVPIGIAGTDLDSLHPPISLLQGFNILSFESLNNIIVIINSTLKRSYELEFNETEYSELLDTFDASFDNYYSGPMRNVAQVDFNINESKGVFDEEDGFRFLYEKPKIIVEEFFKSSSLDLMKSGTIFLFAYGIQMRFNGSQKNFTISLHPLGLRPNLRIIYELIKKVYRQIPRSFSFRIYFIDDANIESGHFQIASRIENSEIKFSKNLNLNENHYQFRNMVLKFEKKYVMVYCKYEDLQSLEIEQLVKCLHEQKIIHIKEGVA